MDFHFRLVSLLFILSTSCFGQNTFELVLDGPEDEIHRNCFQTDQAGYFMAYMSRIEYTSPYFVKLAHITPAGAVDKTAEIVNPEGDCFINNLLRTGPDNLTGIGEWRIAGQNSKAWYIGMDTSLNILWDKKYDIPYDWIPFMQSIISSNEKIETCFSVAQYPSLGTSELLFLETDFDGDSVNGRYLLSGNGSIIFDLMEFQSSYLAFVHGFTVKEQNSSISMAEVLKLDHELSLLAIDSLPLGLNNCITSGKKNDSDYYLCGNGWFGSQFGQVALAQLDSCNNVINHTFYGQTDTVDYGGFDKSLSIFSPDTIYIAGTKNVYLYTPYYSSGKSYFFLNCYDSSLNLRWTRFYGGDVYYCLRILNATPDGGVVMAGTKYDDLNPDNKLDIYIIKVNEEGLMTSARDAPIVVSHEAIVYPNPGSDYLIIESGPQIAGATFTMTDIRGRTVLQATLSQRSIRLSTAGLSSGVYPWNVTYQNKIVESGKWTLSK